MKSLLRALQRVLLPSARLGKHLVWVILALLLIASAAANPYPSLQQNPTPSPAITSSPLSVKTPTSTVSAVAIEQINETNGIIIGGVVLVLIILGGTLQALRPHPTEKS